MKKKATDSEIRAFIEAICPEAPDLYMASFDEATCLRDATDLIRKLREADMIRRLDKMGVAVIRADERTKVLREVAALMRLDMSRGPLQQTRRDECEFWAARIESLAALPAASEKEKS